VQYFINTSIALTVKVALYILVDTQNRGYLDTWIRSQVVILRLRHTVS
jgi:hypothetical protein